MKIKVKNIRYIFTEDIDVTTGYDVSELDRIVTTCVDTSIEALRYTPPPGYSEFERDQLVQLVEGLKYSHSTIQRLLQGERNPSAVDALVIARCQMETLYSVCFLLNSGENMRLLLKNVWKKRYVRFLLDREETKNIPRFKEFFERTGEYYIENLRRSSFVTDEEKLTIECEQLGTISHADPASISSFPTPIRIIEQCSQPSQREMLSRLYPEYQFLCSFVHGDPESSFFRTASDPRSPKQHLVEVEKTLDFYQRQILGPPVLYSTLSTLQIATELAAIFKSSIELHAKAVQGWTVLLKHMMLARPIWEIRSKNLLGVI